MESVVEELLRRLEVDGVEYVRFEACNINGQSFGKTVPIRHIRSVFKSGLPIYCGTWFFTVLFGNACDTMVNGLTFRNSYNFPCADTYCVLPYVTNNKVARIMMTPRIKIGHNLHFEEWPVDPRTICLQQIRKLEQMGYSILSSFEHEFQILDAHTHKPLWNGKEFCSNNKFSLYQEWAFSVEKHLFKMGIDIEQMHVEYSPGQFEFPMKPAFGIRAGDNSFTFRNSIKQIAAQSNYLATFATTPFPDATDGASNGAHWNFSLWSNRQNKQPQTTQQKNDGTGNSSENKDNCNAFYDDKSEHQLSDIAQFFISGIIEHIDALTAFANITANCYRRTNLHAWSPGNVTYGKNNRTVLLRLKTDGQEGTYMEYRLPPSACNPYLVMTSVIAAGIDGIKNKTKPKYPMCEGDAFDAQFTEKYKVPKLPQDMHCAITALKKNKIIWDAFGDRFCHMFISTKNLEMMELEQLSKEIGREKAETQMFLNI